MDTPKTTPFETGALQDAILNSANFSSIATDEKGVIQIFNVGAERMLGYSAAEVMNKITPADISDPQELIARAEALSTELSTSISPGFEALVFKASRGIEDIYELTYIRKDGSRFPAVVSVTALRDGQNAIIGYLLIGTDNTARKQAEEALLQAGALQRAIFNSANFSSIATDAKGVIQIFNVGAERMLGYRADEVMNKITPADISDPQELIARAATLSAELATPIMPGFEALVFKASRGIEDIYELTYIRKDRSRFPAMVSVTALRDAQETIIGYLLIGTDNTARKEVEAEQKKLDQLLKAKNIELESARLAADRANQAKSDFLSNMSHELRSPLNAILGFAQLMDSDIPPATTAQKTSIEQILQAGWYLLDLINEILDLSVIESGKLSLSEEPVSLAEVFAECQSMVGPQAKKRAITLTFPAFDEPCFVFSDRTRLKQVLINLLSNAIKYNQPGGAVIVKRIASGAERTRISVRDTGPGLAADKVSQLFQPFNRLGQEHGAVEGTGIGLVMSKRLVELMGGVIGVESTVGIGSVFWFELRTAAEPTLAHDELPLVQPAAPELAASAARRTVLYVEDNPANLKLVEQLIARRPDLALLSAIEGASGVQLAKDKQPDVILMDINLPGMSGFEALERLREAPVTAHIPVLALSANAMPGDIKRGLDAGFFRYLTKPINVVKFMAALDVALEFAAVGKGLAQLALPMDTAPVAEAGEFAGHRVLLADDDEANRFVATSFLTRLGFEVDAAEDGAQAIQMASERTYSCLLMDVQMPEMDGIEATRRIRAASPSAPGKPVLPIIAMTANALSGDRERLLAAGMTDYVSKPIERNALLQALRRQVLKISSQHAPGLLQAAVPAALKVVNASGAFERMGIPHEAMGGMLIRFANRLPKRLAALGAAVAAANHGEIHQHAHSLSGTAGSLGIERLSFAAGALETSARSQAGVYAELFASVETEARAVLAALIPTPEHAAE